MRQQSVRKSIAEYQQQASGLSHEPFVVTDIKQLHNSESPEVQYKLLLKKYSDHIVKFSDQLNKQHVTNNIIDHRKSISNACLKQDSSTETTTNSHSAPLPTSKLSHITASSAKHANYSSPNSKDTNNKLFANTKYLVSGSQRKIDSDADHHVHAPGSKDCHVCLIKDVRNNLANMNKVVQEQNQQISNLKAKCLRSYFERQIADRH